MTLEEEIKQLKQEIKDLRLVQDVVFSESLRKRVLQNIIYAGVTSTSLADINETTNIPSTPSSITHAEAYDKKVRVEIDGVAYFIGLYTA